MKGEFSDKKLLEIASQFICDNWEDFCKYYEQELLFGAGLEEQEQIKDELEQLHKDFCCNIYN